MVGGRGAAAWRRRAAQRWQGGQFIVVVSVIVRSAGRQSRRGRVKRRCFRQ